MAALCSRCAFSLLKIKQLKWSPAYVVFWMLVPSMGCHCAGALM